ncbi:MAG TPA: cell division protein ZapA [Peptococcaceae bacterium]|jgi:cell division protein ZapA|nr:cell division protein ZapA [Clostridia bacterium]HOB81489.1 cell division protein ZapA [Peptococcaceae bacterium]HPZ71779.1 cell division protein ZapA [Peptococcaceae bacterium]HQD53576.1 cell division protein ZapA [Peptococcaceae bacterium]
MKQKDREREKMNKCTVTIFNEEYVVKGQADRSHIEKVSTYVDRMMKQISQKNPGLSPKQLAVLTAINVTDELLVLRTNYDDLIKLLDEADK